MRRIRIIVLIITLFLGLVGCQKNDDKKVSLETVEETKDVEHEQETAENTSYNFVYVCGAVKREGVYELPVGSRVYQAIEAAGGFLEDANVRNVNQAEILEDEARVYVPVIGEEVQTDSDDEGKININKASKEELMTLPGVGESRAESIIKYREEQGAFRKVEDIMQVSGIKEGLFEKIKDYITI